MLAGCNQYNTFPCPKSIDWFRQARRLTYLLKKVSGRPGGIRTPNMRFWRPPLYQLELLACAWHPLAGFAMHRVGLAPLAVLFVLDTLGITLFVLLGRVVTSFTLSTRQGDQCTHQSSHFLCTRRPNTQCAGPLRYNVYKQLSYLMIFVTRPEPTVRPPSRIAKRSPSSIAIGAMSSPLIKTLSPGMTISTPSGRWATPVTSVVRK